MEDYRLTQSGQEVQDILDGAAMQVDLTAEVQRAQEAEQALGGQIDDEETRAKAAEKQNADDIADEEARAKGAEGTLQDNIDAEETRAKAAEKSNADDIDALEDAIEAILLLIPSAATSLNQLADKAFVNSSIATASATFRGTYNLVTDLSLAVTATHAQIAAALAGAVSGADNNDYAFVQIPTSVETPTEIRVTERYKFDGTAWSYEYDLNNSGFTAAQWEAINSGITTALVAKLSALPTNADLTTALGVLTDGIAAINAKIPSEASSSNKLVDNAAMVSYVGQILDAIDATFNITSTDGHVTVQITQTNGEITAVAVTTSDIASAADLTLLAGRVTTAEGNISTNAEDIAALQDAYAALTKNAPEIIEPTDTWPVANPSTTVIYRVVDRVNTPPQYYSDYMWNGTTMVLMAQYNNAIDDEPTPGSNNLVKSGGVAANIVYDISAANAVGGVLATYANLAAALGASGANIPQEIRRGGMSIKFVRTYDNKYVQYRLMSDTFNTTPANWQGVDDEPIDGSKNLTESGGVRKLVNSVIGAIADKSISVSGNTATNTGIKLKSGVKYAIYVQCSTAVDNSLTGVWYLVGSEFTRIKDLTAAEYASGTYFEYTANADGTLCVRPYAPGTVKVTVWNESDFKSLNELNLKIEDEISQFNVNKHRNDYTPYEGSETGCNTARTHIPVEYRKVGLYITFLTTAGWITELFIGGTDLDLSDNSVWRNADYWLPTDFNLVDINQKLGKVDTPYESLLDALTDLKNTYKEYNKRGVTIKALLSSEGSTPDYVMYQYINTTSFNYFTAIGYWKRIDHNLIEEIASDSFQYSNLVYSNGLLTQARIRWADKMFGTMSITYSNGRISYIDYTHNNDTYRQSLVYTNGEFTSNSIVKL